MASDLKKNCDWNWSDYKSEMFSVAISESKSPPKAPGPWGKFLGWKCNLQSSDRTGVPQDNSTYCQIIDQSILPGH